MVTPAAKREAVAHLQALLDVSARRASRVIAADRSVIRYQSRRDEDGRLREKLRDDPANPRVILTVRGKGYVLGEECVVRSA